MKYLLWLAKGRPLTTYHGAWCGICGHWVADAEIVLRDYEKLNNFSRIIVCEDCARETWHEH